MRALSIPPLFFPSTQMPFGQALCLPRDLAPFDGVMPDHFVRVAPPERGCFVESGDVPGGGAKMASALAPVVTTAPPYKSMDDFFRIVGSRAQTFPQQVSDHTIEILSWILEQKPDWPTAKRVLQLVLDQGERDEFIKSWLALGLINNPEESADFLAFARSATITGAAILAGAHTDPTAFGLKFPQELWKDYGTWWADLQKQAETFVRVHMKLLGAEAEAKIRELLELEKTNYEKLLPLKAKAHASIRNSLLLIPGGMFMMGADDIYTNVGSTLRSDVYAVWLSSFLMMDVPVTNRMWQAVMGTRPSAQYDRKGHVFSGDNQPVVGASYDDALEFIQKIQLDGGGRIRLESEIQYKYVVQATRDYEYGTQTGKLKHNLAVYSNGKSGDDGHTAPVKSKPATPFMVYDLCGNVWEYCEDRWEWWWRGCDEEAQINPVVIAAAEYDDEFVYRGGSWATDDERGLRASFRGCASHDRRDSGSGFRLVVGCAEDS